MSPEVTKYVRDYVLQNPAARLSDIATVVQLKFGISVSLSSLSQTILHKEKLTLKVGDTRWMERNPEEAWRFRSFYATEIAPYYSTDQVFFLDETSFDPRHLAVKRVRGPKGVSTYACRKGGPVGQRYSVCATLGVEGIKHRVITTGTFTADKFLDNTIELLGMIPGCVLVMDNASIHALKGKLDALMQLYDVRIVFLPKYSPFLNPIEVVFAWIKAFVHTHFKDMGRLPAILAAFDDVAKKNIRGLYEKHGYSH
ncbi:DDE superfamily endonuclease [Carpediemonas membranifera]|uniref:DDE superfamily endonuclease n=1 Tax=Carpediemonas membranifera TaxID=201153 RepID=A0A8J6E4G1_9EUKA|nr:DDE superfamily endonuclease [Carpediemonas membranifera]|eukprot:KAG9394417.1 DDE superfamily endonuclease [Carpediemonas membranifera]